MIDRSIYRFKAKRACIIANKIIAVSECTKQDLIDFYQIDPSKITVLPVSINVNLKKFDSQIHSKEFVVCISSYLKRKNQALLVDAFCLIADQVNFDLILIGKGSELNYIQKLAKESGYSDRIIFKTELKDDEKFQYLSQAKFSVYPSKFEGFGIPIIESLSYQTPILVSDTEIHREVGGDAVFYFKNNDIQDLKDKFIYMNELSESEKNDKSQKGLQKINSYRSEALMPRLKSIYDEVLNPI